MKITNKILIYLILTLILLSNNILKSDSFYAGLIDSLENELKVLKNDTAIIEAHIRLSYQYSSSNQIKGLEHGFMALDLSKKLKYELGKSWAYNRIGVNYGSVGNYSKNLEYYLKALKINYKLNDSFPIANTLGNISGVYYSMNKFQKAKEYNYKSLEIYEKLKMPGGIAFNYMALSKNLLGEKKWDSLELCLNYALDLYKSRNVPSRISEVYLKFGDVEKTKLNFSKSIEYYKKSLEVLKDFKEHKIMIIPLLRFAELYSELAEDSIRKKIILSKSSKDKHLLQYNREYYLELAEDYAKRANYQAINSNDIHLMIFENLKNIYDKKNQMDSAFKYSELINVMRDSLVTSEGAMKIGMIEAERKIEEEKFKKTLLEISRAKEIKKRNILQYFGIGIIVIALGIFLVLSGRLKLKTWMVRALVFLTFIFTFEFFLVMLDSWTDDISEGIPFLKFVINVTIALIIFPMHQYFERKVSQNVIKENN